MLETTPQLEIIRSHRRKRLAIRVLEGRVQLLMPKRCAESTAQAFLNENTRWIQKKLQEYSNTTPYYPKQYIDGEHFLYLGKNHALNIAFSKQPTTMARDEQIFVFVRETPCPEKRKKQIYQQLRFWYWQQAENFLKQKTDAYAQKLQVQHKSVSIRQFKSRWGSCSVKGDIEYSWQIIMAPEQIIDYLVAHELSHIKHHNHSPEFWKVVESVIPDYRNCKNWLKVNGHLLKLD